MANADVIGLKELTKAIKAVKKELPDQLDDASVDIATDWLHRAQTIAHPAQQARAAASLDVQPSGSGGATLSSDLPWFAGAEFGGGSRPRTRQFPAYRGGRGYFLYPAQDTSKDMDVIGDAVDKAFKPWNSSGIRGLLGGLI